MKKSTTIILAIMISLSATAQPFFLNPIPIGNKCVGNNISYRAPAGKTNYQWEIPGSLGIDYMISGGSISTTSFLVIIRWLTTGVKTVTINWNGSGGTSAGSTITVNDNPMASFIIEPPANICPADTVYFKTQGGQSNYVWNNQIYTTVEGGGTTDSFLTCIFGGTGNNTVSVNYTDAHGCKSVADAVNIANTYSPQGPLFSSAPPSTYPINTSAIYASGYGYGIANYVWSISGVQGIDYTIIDGGISSEDWSVTVQWLTTGDKTVTVNWTDANGCSNYQPASVSVTTY